MVNWALNNLDLWVKQFLIAENNYRVRFEAAEVLMMLIPDSGHLYNYWKSCVDKFSLPDSNKNGTVQYEERVLTVVHKVCSFNVGFSITGFPRAPKHQNDFIVTNSAPQSKRSILKLQLIGIFWKFLTIHVGARYP